MAVASGVIAGASVLASVGTSIYSAEQAKKTSDAQIQNADQLAAASQNNKIQLPNTESSAATMQQSAQRAATAGGSVTTPTGPVGDQIQNQRKSILGS